MSRSRADRKRERALGDGLNCAGYHVEQGTSREAFLNLMAAYYDFHVEFSTRLTADEPKQQGFVLAENFSGTVDVQP